MLVKRMTMTLVRAALLLPLLAACGTTQPAVVPTAAPVAPTAATAPTDAPAIGDAGKVALPDIDPASVSGNIVTAERKVPCDCDECE